MKIPKCIVDLNSLGKLICLNTGFTVCIKTFFKNCIKIQMLNTSKQNNISSLNFHLTT